MGLVHLSKTTLASNNTEVINYRYKTTNESQLDSVLLDVSHISSIEADMQPYIEKRTYKLKNIS